LDIKRLSETWEVGWKLWTRSSAVTLWLENFDRTTPDIARNFRVVDSNHLGVMMTKKIDKSEVESILNVKLLETEFETRKCSYTIPLPYPVVKNHLDKFDREKFLQVDLLLDTNEERWT
jgi:hypothetical protein